MVEHACETTELPIDRTNDKRRIEEQFEFTKPDWQTEFSSWSSDLVQKWYQWNTVVNASNRNTEQQRHQIKTLSTN